MHVKNVPGRKTDTNDATWLSDLMGKSGRAFLKALISGEGDPEKLASHGSSRLRSSRQQIVESLRGKVSAIHRVHLKLHLAHIVSVEGDRHY